MEMIGLEPTTSCMPCKRSSQVSYTPKSCANCLHFFTILEKKFAVKTEKLHSSVKKKAAPLSQ